MCVLVHVHARQSYECVWCEPQQALLHYGVCLRLADILSLTTRGRQENHLYKTAAFSSLKWS
jgi:hypothetical protein